MCAFFTCKWISALASFAGSCLQKSSKINCFLQRQSRSQMRPDPTSEHYCPESGVWRAEKLANFFFFSSKYVFLPGLMVFSFVMGSSSSSG